MVRELIHDPIFLAGKSEIATINDLQIAKDLLETLMAYRETCVGMAANMIGERKRKYKYFGGNKNEKVSSFVLDSSFMLMLSCIVRFVNCEK